MSAKTWKDLLNVPIVTLKDGVKDFVEISFNYWAHWLEENAPIKPEPVTDTAEAEPEAGPVIADDLTMVLDNNKAIAEKYQAAGTDSLLDYIAAQLATVRGCKKEDVLDEIKTALYVPDEKRELLSMHKVERAEFLAKQVVKENPELVKAVSNNDKTAIKQLDKKIVDNAHGLVNDADLKFALRHVLRAEMKSIAFNKEAKAEESGA